MGVEKSVCELLVLQPTAFCNLDCGYCYVPDRSDTQRMDLRTIERTVELFIANPERLGSQLEVLWHAGEPLAAGRPFYEAAESAFEPLRNRTELVQTIQTNGTLITDEWCAFFKQNAFEVGVSVDGPQEIHDAVRKTRRGGGSFNATMQGVSRLQDHNIPVSALAVVTEASLKRPADIFNFFKTSGIGAVGFNVEEIEGENSHSVFSDVSLQIGYKKFLKKLHEMNLSTGSPLRIREFQAAVQALLLRRENPGFEPVPAETVCGRILTVARNGDVFSFSPELASGVPGEPGAFKIGNVHEADSLDEIIDGNAARKLQSVIASGVSLCRDSCSHFGVCGGGSPANKIYENGDFASTSTIKCRMQIQSINDLLLDLADAHT